VWPPAKVLSDKASEKRGDTLVPAEYATAQRPQSGWPELALSANRAVDDNLVVRVEVRASAFLIVWQPAIAAFSALRMRATCTPRRGRRYKMSEHGSDHQSDAPSMPTELGPSSIDVSFTKGHVALDLTWQEQPDLHTTLVLTAEQARRVAHSIEEPPRRRRKPRTYSTSRATNQGVSVPRSSGGALGWGHVPKKTGE
jgi:hypothetical protein